MPINVTHQMVAFGMYSLRLFRNKSKSWFTQNEYWQGFKTLMSIKRTAAQFLIGSFYWNICLWVDDVVVTSAYSTHVHAHKNRITNPWKLQHETAAAKLHCTQLLRYLLIYVRLLELFNRVSMKRFEEFKLTR